MAKKKSKHYVNNKDFFEAMCEYKKQYEQAEKEGKEKPQVSIYIGECIMKIAVNLSHKPNFINYPFKEEMISDGIENSLTYMHNFNPEKSQNPFAYFTQIIYYAYLRRIAKEKKHLYTKYKYGDHLLVGEEGFDIQDHDSAPIKNSKSNEWSRDHIDTFIEDFEEKLKQKKIGIKPVDVFMEEN